MLGTLSVAAIALQRPANGVSGRDLHIAHHVACMDLCPGKHSPMKNVCAITVCGSSCCKAKQQQGCYSHVLHHAGQLPRVMLAHASLDTYYYVGVGELY